MLSIIRGIQIFKKCCRASVAGKENFQLGEGHGDKQSRSEGLGEQTIWNRLWRMDGLDLKQGSKRRGFPKTGDMCVVITTNKCYWTVSNHTRIYRSTSVLFFKALPSDVTHWLNKMATTLNCLLGLLLDRFTKTYIPNNHSCLCTHSFWLKRI